VAEEVRLRYSWKGIAQKFLELYNYDSKE